jgi:hypothetical protein
LEVEKKATQETGMKHEASLLFDREWGQHIPPKHQSTFSGLNGIVFEKIEFLTVRECREIISKEALTFRLPFEFMHCALH